MQWPTSATVASDMSYPYSTYGPFKNRRETLVADVVITLRTVAFLALAVSCPKLVFGQQETIVFKELELPHPATWMEMSADGRTLVFGHNLDHGISVYSVLEKKVLATFETASPRNVLYRRGKIYVGSPDSGQFRIFEESAGQWKETKTYPLPKSGLVHMSAAGDKFFRGQIVFNFHESRYDTAVFAMSGAGRFRQISKDSVVSVSHNGKLIIKQERFDQSPSGQITGFEYRDYLARGDKATKLFSGGDMQTSFVFQVSTFDCLVGRDAIYGGEPFKRFPGAWGNLILMDRAQDIAYVIQDSKMTARRLKPMGDLVGERAIEYPDPFSEMRKLRHGFTHQRKYVLDHPEAVTLGDKTFMFIRTAVDGTVLTAEATPFVTPATPLAADEACETKTRSSGRANLESEEW